MQYQLEGVAQTSSQQQALEALTLPPGSVITVHMVHLNHLDLTWYWRLPETFEMVLETIRWHTELLEAHPDARYSHTQVFPPRLVEAMDPALFARFAALVRAGQVEVDSGQVVEPDHNLIQGESLVRQFLYGQRYLRSRFGVQATTLVNSDTFGHCRTLPQIMRQAGIEHFLFKRPRQRSVDLPESPFRWQGLDGTSIPALRFINKGAGLPSLSQYYTLPAGVSDLQEKVNRNLAAGVTHLFGSHCNADSGGVTPYAAPCAGEQYRLRYATPTDFFIAMLAEAPALPLIDKGLNFIFEGCYTTHIEEKEHCRQAERAPREVELLYTHAALAGKGYPRAALEALWWRLCYLQFHDIIPGTGSPEAHADSAAHYHELLLQAQLLRRRVQLTLGGEIATPTPSRTLVVANPHAHAMHGIVEVDVEMPWDRARPGSSRVPLQGYLQAADGAQQVPYQIVATRQRQRFIRGTLLCNAAVPGLGLSRYLLPQQEAPAPPPAVPVEGNVLENAHLRVEVGGPGLINSLRDRQGREWLAAPVRLELWPETVYHGDYGNPMQAWVLGDTDAREAAGIVGEPEMVECGPVRSTLRVVHQWGQSRFTTDVSLYADQPWVELRVEIDWQEVETLARLCVEPRITGDPRRTFGIPFGTETATGEEREVAAIGWADLSGADGGLALLCADRPGATFREGALRLSLVRCATGDHDPRTDRGRITATVRLLPHTGEADLPRHAAELLSPLTAWQADGAGCYAHLAPPVLLTGDGVLLAACKATEDGDGYLIRLWESLGQPTTATLTIAPALAGNPVHRTNLLEDREEELMVQHGTVRLALRPYEIVSIRIATPKPIPDPQGEGFGLFGG